jgi:hypothetical protein
VAEFEILLRSAKTISQRMEVFYLLGFFEDVRTTKQVCYKISIE